MNFEYVETRVLQTNIFLVRIPQNLIVYEPNIILELNNINPNREIVIIIIGENNITYKRLRNDKNYDTLCVAAMTYYLKVNNNLCWNKLRIS